MYGLQRRMLFKFAGLFEEASAVMKNAGDSDENLKAAENLLRELGTLIGTQR